MRNDKKITNMTAEELLILEQDIAAKKKQLDEAKRKIREALALKIGNYILSQHKEITSFEDAKELLSTPAPEAKPPKKPVRKTKNKPDAVPSSTPEESTIPDDAATAVDTALE